MKLDIGRSILRPVVFALCGVFLFSVPGYAKAKKNSAFPSFSLAVLQPAKSPSASAGEKRGAEKRMVASIDGKSITTEMYKGKIVLVDFWASWCEPCKLSLPAYDKLQTKYKKKGLVVLGINVDEDESKARDFLNAHKVNFAVAYDPGQKFAGQLEIATMPTSYVLDRKGNMKSVHQGFRDGDAKEIEKAIKKLL
jgi:thiol-disulfide isomerase/thioredoxin